MWSSTRSKTFPDSEIACIEKVRKKREERRGREREERKKREEEEE
jgi:hypothetical protein